MRPRRLMLFAVWSGVSIVAHAAGPSGGACAGAQTGSAHAGAANASGAQAAAPSPGARAATPADATSSAAARSARARGTAIFAGGCFWCEETAFEGLPGVLSVTSGYTGGTTKNPTYEAVSSGVTGHAESVQVVYDPARTSYAKLLDVFWHSVDPLQRGGQFCDHGTQYRSAIFYADEDQRKAAEESKRKLEADPRFKGLIATQIVAASTFYAAEEYHQDYYKKNPVHYAAYRLGCGRDARLEALWGDAAGGGH